MSFNVFLIHFRIILDYQHALPEGLPGTERISNQYACTSHMWSIILFIYVDMFLNCIVQYVLAYEWVS